MNVEHTSEEIITYPDNEHIEKIIRKHNGECTVYYRNGSLKDIQNVETCSFHSVLGYPVSADGKILFAGSWRKGVTAYDISCNRVIWNVKRSNICGVFVYPTYVVAVCYGKGIVKLRIDNGELLGEVKTGTIEHVFAVDRRNIFVESIRGKLSLVDTETLSPVKRYNWAVANPNQCLSFLIQGCYLREGSLWIHGIEDYPDRDPTAENPTPFSRLIDENIYELL